MPALSIVIPAAPDEPALPRLLTALEDQIDEDVEVRVARGRSRADALNQGTAAATGSHVWWLHADTRLRGGEVAVLRRAMASHPDALLWFDLAYDDDGPSWTWINAWGANRRSRVFGAPYGDQGLCLSREAFLRVGGFPEEVAFGEDHVFVWRCKRAGIVLAPVGVPLVTSARRYREQGWGWTSAVFFVRFWQQALPEAWALWRGP